MGFKNQFKKTKKQLSTSPEMLVAKSFKTTNRRQSKKVIDKLITKTVDVGVSKPIDYKKSKEYILMQNKYNKLYEEHGKLKQLLDARIQEHRKILENFSITADSLKNKITILEHELEQVNTNHVDLQQRYSDLRKVLSITKAKNELLVHDTQRTLWIKFKRWLISMFKS